MMASVHVAQMKFTPEKLAKRTFTKEMTIDVLDEDTGKLMEYRRLMKNPKYRPLYRK